jgi:hypothetical protein
VTRPSGEPPKRLVLPPTLIVRDSCMPRPLRDESAVPSLSRRLSGWRATWPGPRPGAALPCRY